MHRDMLDEQIRAVCLNPPAIVLLVLAPLNDVIRRIHIHVVAIPILGGVPMTARTTAALHMGIAEGTALGGEVGLPIQGNPLIPDVHHLNVLDETVARIDEQAVADPVRTPIDREVAYGNMRRTLGQLKAGRGAARRTQDHGFAGRPLHGTVTRGTQIVLVIGTAMNSEGIAAREPAEALANGPAGGIGGTGGAITARRGDHQRVSDSDNREQEEREREEPAVHRGSPSNINGLPYTVHSRP